MDKSIDILINETKANILKTINDSNLPISITELIISQIYNVVQIQYNNEIQKQVKEFNDSKNKENEENQDKDSKERPA